MRSAIILASFGSADDSIREKIFDKLAAEIKEKFSAYEVRQAFTSNFMIKKLAARGILIATPAEEISKLRAEGFKKIFLLSTHLTAGEEFDNKIKICAAPDDEDLILIGHGSPHRHTPVYENLQKLAGEKIHVGVIEENDTPNFSDVVKRLKNSGAKKILLAPLLFNGGVHVAKDIAGEKNSWKAKLSALGYEVRVIRDGLGSFENFRELYIKNLEVRINGK